MGFPVGLKKKLIPPLTVIGVILLFVLLHYCLFGSVFIKVLSQSKNAEVLVGRFSVLYYIILLVGVGFGFLMPIILVVRRKNVSRKLLIIAVLVSVGIIFSSFVLSCRIPIDIMYRSELSKHEYVADCCRNGSAACVWGFVESVASEFSGTYGENLVKPQIFIMKRRLPFFGVDEVSKLAVISKTGACLDFALGITRILRDLGCPTRIIDVGGVDHAVPEVMMGGKWYVIDAVYTTPSHPVEAHQWASYIAEHEPECFNAVARLVDMTTGRDVTDEHGFNTSLVTIEAVIDPTAKKGDERPAKRAEVLILVPSSRSLYKILAYRGNTNEEGLATVKLVAGRDYIVLVKCMEPKDPYHKEVYMGAECIYIPQNTRTFKTTIKLYHTEDTTREDTTRLTTFLGGITLGIAITATCIHLKKYLKSKSIR